MASKKTAIVAVAIVAAIAIAGVALYYSGFFDSHGNQKSSYEDTWKPISGNTACYVFNEPTYAELDISPFKNMEIREEIDGTYTIKSENFSFHAVDTGEILLGGEPGESQTIYTLSVAGNHLRLSRLLVSESPTSDIIVYQRASVEGEKALPIFPGDKNWRPTVGEEYDSYSSVVMSEGHTMDITDRDHEFVADNVNPGSILYRETHVERGSAFTYYFACIKYGMNDWICAGYVDGLKTINIIKLDNGNIYSYSAELKGEPTVWQHRFGDASKDNVASIDIEDRVYYGRENYLLQKNDGTSESVASDVQLFCVNQDGGRAMIRTISDNGRSTAAWGIAMYENGKNARFYVESIAGLEDSRYKGLYIGDFNGIDNIKISGIAFNENAVVLVRQSYGPEYAGDMPKVDSLVYDEKSRDYFTITNGGTSDFTPLGLGARTYSKTVIVSNSLENIKDVTTDISKGTVNFKCSWKVFDYDITIAFTNVSYLSAQVIDGNLSISLGEIDKSLGVTITTERICPLVGEWDLVAVYDGSWTGGTATVIENHMATETATITPYNDDIYKFTTDGMTAYCSWNGTHLIGSGGNDPLILVIREVRNAEGFMAVSYFNNGEAHTGVYALKGVTDTFPGFTITAEIPEAGSVWETIGAKEYTDSRAIDHSSENRSITMYGAMEDMIFYKCNYNGEAVYDCIGVYINGNTFIVCYNDGSALSYGSAEFGKGVAYTMMTDSVSKNNWVINYGEADYAEYTISGLTGKTYVGTEDTVITNHGVIKEDRMDKSITLYVQSQDQNFIRISTLDAEGAETATWSGLLIDLKWLGQYGIIIQATASYGGVDYTGVYYAYVTESLEELHVDGALTASNGNCVTISQTYTLAAN